MSKTDFMNSLLKGCAVAGLVVALSAVPVVPDFQTAEAAISERSIRYFEKAQGQIEKGNLSAAVIELKNAVRSDANNTEARFQLAQIYLAQGDAAGAEKELKAAQSRGFDANQTVPLIAQAYIQQSKFEALVKDLAEETLTGEPQAVLEVYRAQAHVNLEQIDEAESALSRARAIAPDMAQIFMVHSWLRQSQGDLKGAEALIDVALEKDPESLEALIQKGELRRLASDFDSAYEVATKAIQISPVRHQPRVTRGLAEAARGNVDKVLEDAEALLELNPRDPAGAYLKAWALSQKNNIEAALRALQAAPSVDSYMPALYLGAVLHLQAGELEQARARINRFVSQNPDNAQAAAVSATIYYRAGEYQAAVDILETLYAREPGNVSYATLLAQSWQQLGEAGKAAALYDEAMNLAPENEELQLRSAQARITSGDLEGAVTDLAKLAEQGDGSARASTLLFLTQLRAGDYEAASAALDKIEALSGQSAETENFRASIALRSGDREAAEAHLRKALEREPNYQAARLNLARLFRANGEVDKAKSEYLALLTADRGYFPAIVGLVEIATQARDTEEAIRLADEAVKYNSDNERAHLLKVNQLARIGEMRRALAAARDFSASLPESLSALDALGQVQSAAGDLASAVVTYQQLTGLAPDNATAHLRLADVLIRAKRESDAIFSLDKAISLDGSNEQARQQRIRLENEIYGKERAVSLAQRMYGASGEEAEQRIGLGRALFQLGDQDEGLKLMRSGFEVSGSRIGMANLSNALDVMGRAGEATAIMSAWLADNPEEQDIRLVLLSRHINAADWQSAITEGEILRAASADNPVVLNNLAWVYEKVGRIEDAIATGKKAHQIAPTAWEIADTYGWILAVHGDANEAVLVLGEAAAAAPKRPDIQYHHAVALAKAGQVKAAKAVLTRILEGDTNFPEREDAARLLNELN